MVSSERSLVFGPITPIVRITTIMAKLMKTNTPVTPARARINSMMNAVKIAENRLQE